MASDDEGRVATFTAWVVAREPSLFRTAVLLCSGDRAAAEDLVQATLARLWLRWHRLRPDDGLDGYARRVMCSLHTSWWRRRSSHESPTGDLPDQAARDAIESVIDRHMLCAALRRLPPAQRAAVVLRCYDDLTEAEAARVLGCSVGTIKSRTARGLEKLRRILAAHDVPVTTLARTELRR